MLAELGDPWQPDPTLSDAELLPEYPTGGDGNYDLPDRVQVLPKGGVTAVGSPPMNAYLRAVWREEGLLADPEDAPAKPKRSRRKTTMPAPADGG